PVAPHSHPVGVVVERLEDPQLVPGLLALAVELLEGTLVVGVGAGGQDAVVPPLARAALVVAPQAADVAVVTDDDVDEAETRVPHPVVLFLEVGPRRDVGTPEPLAAAVPPHREELVAVPVEFGHPHTLAVVKVVLVLQLADRHVPVHPLAAGTR